MDIYEAGGRPSRKVTVGGFVGGVWQDPIVEAPSPSRLRSAWLRYDPGARSGWHTHPLGQVLHVVFGVGLVQVWGEAPRIVRAGDTIWFSPDEKHWHGAHAAVGVTQVTMHEHLNGQYLKSMEPLSDEEYASIAAVAE